MLAAVVGELETALAVLAVLVVAVLGFLVLQLVLADQPTLEAVVVERITGTPPVLVVLVL
jgi:hypothetical protein